jgi:hypothetical protein
MSHLSPRRVDEKAPHHLALEWDGVCDNDDELWMSEIPRQMSV